MNTKNLVALSLLVGMGAVLHVVVPGFFLGMKPDMMLTMMFLGIILFPDKKSVLLVGVVTGLISGLTTTFSGGLVPNIIDKPITAFVFFGILMALKNFKLSIYTAAGLTAIGTIVSGIVFLGSAYFLVGLPGPFTALFAAVVLPTAAFSAVFMAILHPVATNIFKRAKLAEIH
ncbi:tryptophan transporter [Bacillus sp. 17376]|uniref:Substrate-specific component TrpP of tryptophan ECF transporter n=1 Tax=Mesobacillus boroniphilus JCM 21738 TaxID=1294265 RepID=W4RNS3_9BACI|nr:tryptophan transporter [Mesobacillus boroniphilus]ESU32495.1 tryptophan transporter [Bacillus sp. 17376]GAE46075.1 substrate-specific component TrpP of tryptophan ECF transporter [Mesobacillus boroniphilus JCM 21738]